MRFFQGAVVSTVTQKHCVVACTAVGLFLAFSYFASVIIKAGQFAISNPI